jgi:hypothetical protein
MIVLGVIVLIIGWLTHISILYTVGSILLVVGLVLLLLGAVGRGVGGRRVVGLGGHASGRGVPGTGTPLLLRLRGGSSYAAVFS